jgi:hypothetical protein
MARHVMRVRVTNTEPERIMQMIYRSLRVASKQVEIENETEFWQKSRIKCELVAYQVTGFLIGAGARLGGMSVQPEFTYCDEPFSVKHFGEKNEFMADRPVEWVFVVDLSAKTVSIYRGGNGKTAEDAYRGGSVGGLPTRVERLGFRVNPSLREPKAA